MPEFDELRAVVAAGDGVVARFPGVLAVASGPDAAVRRVVELCRESAGPSPGRALARRLAAWLGGDDAPPDDLRFGTVAAATDGGLAVLLRGTVDLLVPDGGVALAGADGAPWTDRLIEPPDAPLSLTLQGAAAPAVPLDGVLDLREGVVPGVAVVAVGHEQVEPDRTGADGTTTGEQRAAVPAPSEPGPADVDDATEVVSLGFGLGHPRHRRPDTGEPALGTPAAARAALRAAPAKEAAPPAPEPDAPPPPSRPKAQGYLCTRGHLNDPRSHVCTQCGTRMDESAGVLVVDERPALGRLVFDDGATRTVDAGHLLGREPEGDARVRSGVLRPVVLDDPSGAMSRVHAEIRLENWDVLLTDSGSSNGTYVAAPGAPVWTGLAAGQAFRLVPGARVRLGQRTFTFETPSGLR